MSAQVTKVIGSTVRLKGTFTDQNDVITDPADVHLYVRSPDAVENTYEYPPDIVKEATGIYYYDLLLDQEGVWIYRLYSSGTGQTSFEGEILVTDLSTPEEPDEIDITKAALGPRRMKTDEGFVEEHKLTDLIMADQYQKAQEAPKKPFFGIAIAKARPKGAP